MIPVHLSKADMSQDTWQVYMTRFVGMYGVLEKKANEIALNVDLSQSTDYTIISPRHQFLAF